jgi:uncharacterized protein (TIGR02996 family)
VSGGEQVTPIDSEHAALLKGIAKNLSDATARKVYADWLQERGNAGWLIVAHYPIEQWPVWIGTQPRAKHSWYGGSFTSEHWRLPWLEGEFHAEKRLSNPKSRAKTIILAYANGETVPKKEPEE